MSLIIRRVESSDLTTLRDLAERTFRDAWQDENEPAEFEAYCRKNFALEHLSAELAQPGSEFYLAFVENEPVAYLKLNVGRPPNWPDDTSPLDRWTDMALQLERIYVRQDIQSRGLGAELLRFTENRARHTGASWLWLSVWQKSPRTIAFYKRNGLEIFGVETFWVGNDPQPDWLMRKKLTMDV